MTIFTGGPVTQSKTLLSDYAITTGEALSAYEDDALRFSPLPAILRGVEQFQAQRDETSPVLTIADQNAKIAEAEVRLKAEEGIRESTLDILIERKRDEAKEQDAIARASGWQTAGGFAAGFVVAAFDPLNVATAYIPVAGPAMYASRLAAQTTRMGRLGTRVGFGAAEGLVGAAAVEPIVALQAANEQADYTMADTLMNLAFGTVLGGGLHGAIGAVGDTINAQRDRAVRDTIAAQRRAAVDEAFARLTPQQREELVRVNLAAAFEDRNMVASPESFQQSLRGSTAMALVTAPTEVKISLTPDTVLVDGAPLRQDIQDHARAANPELFRRFDAIESEMNGRRGQLDDMAASKEVGSELKAVNEELSALKERQAVSNKRNAKRLQRRIDELEATRGELESAAKSTDTPEMARLRTRVRELDLQKRDLVASLSDAVAKSSDELHATGVKRERTTFTPTPLEPPPANPFPNMVQRARSPQNIRTTNFAELDRRTKEFSAQDDRMDMAGAQAETAEIMEDIQRFTTETGDPELKAALDKIVSDEAENVKLAETYENAILAAFQCRIR